MAPLGGRSAYRGVNGLDAENGVGHHCGRTGNTCTITEPGPRDDKPLVLPGLPAGVRDSLCATLTGPSFGAGRPGIRGVPSFDLTDRRYSPRRYWRGPTWLNTTWLLAEGLRTHGEAALAQRLREDMITLVAGAGLREYFNPRTGSGHGTSNFSWSAALLLHVLAHDATPT